MVFLSRPYVVLSRFEPYKITRKGRMLFSFIDMVLMTIALNVTWRTGIPKSQRSEIRNEMLQEIQNESELEQMLVKFFWEILLGFPL